MDLGFDVVKLDEPDYPEEGASAPEFVRPLVNDEYWEDVALSDLIADGPVLLVFHSMDGAFPATYIWKELTDRSFDEQYDVTVVGLSISTPYEHATFIRKRDLPYRLFSDPQNRVAEMYGVVNDLDGFAGVSESRPAVFLIDENRTVQYAWAAREWPEFPEYDEIETALDRL